MASELSRTLSALPRNPSRAQVRSAAEVFLRLQEEASGSGDDHGRISALTDDFNAWLERIPDEMSRRHVHRLFLDELYDLKVQHTNEHLAAKHLPVTRFRDHNVVMITIVAFVLFGAVPLLSYCRGPITAWP
ncbi:MAG TPA: hypothetical protein VGE27_16825 [Gemmatimonas sp.]|uniref:hypothetical protein n=1 Tax=Gemmatimonas sp. TaxID=1962908 RepID=UPI002ED837A0